MAQLTGFGYLPGNTFIHRLDARVKLPVLMFLGIVSLGAGGPTLFLMTGLVVLIAWVIRLRLRAFLVEIRWFLLLLLLVLAARSFSTPGTVWFEMMGLSVSREGLIQGGMICWRLFIIVLAGAEMVAATKPASIRAAVEWFFRPIPGIPEKRTATMISLVIRFIPLILDEARKTAEAQRSRCIEARKNPVIRLVRYVIPTLRRIFERADRLAVAMEARGYNEARPTPTLPFSTADQFVFFLFACLFLLFLLNEFFFGIFMKPIF